MERKYSRTNIFITNEDLWKWAKFRANTLGLNSVSEYLFKLIDKDFQERYKEPDFDDTGLDGCPPGKSIRKVGDQEEE